MKISHFFQYFAPEKLHSKLIWTFFKRKFAKNNEQRIELSSSEQPPKLNSSSAESYKGSEGKRRLNVAQKQINTEKDAEQAVFKTSIPVCKKIYSKPVVDTWNRITICIYDESGDIKKFNINSNQKLKK